MTAPTPPAPSKRKPLTKLEFARLAVEQKGKCGSCGKQLRFEPHQVRDEHIISLFGGGTNDMDNRSLWCVPCSKAKDKVDAKRHAKIRHNQGVTGQTKRRNERKANGTQERVWGKGQQIQSRGFQKPPEGYVSPLSKEGRRR